MQIFTKNKQGILALGQMTGIILTLVVIGVMLTVGSRIEGDIQDDFVGNTTEWNVCEDAMEGLGNVAENQPLMGTIIVYGVIIGIVILAFGMKGGF